MIPEKVRIHYMSHLVIVVIRATPDNSKTELLFFEITVFFTLLSPLKITASYHQSSGNFHQ